MTPTPRSLWVHDDLSALGPALGAPAAELIAALLHLLRADPRVRLLGLDEQLGAVLARGPHAPFAVALGVGRAGEVVARQLHARAGWFPRVRRLDVAREEDGRGGYRLVSTGRVPLAVQVSGLDGCASVAVVDDTVYSGLTLRTVLGALPAAVRGRAHAFCLRGIEASLPGVAALCPLTVGIAAPGRPGDEVTFINASGLVRRGAIRRAGRPPLAFFERPEWIRTWFPGYHEEVLDLCRRLHAALDGA